MRPVVVRLFALALAAVVGAACNDEKTGPRGSIQRAELNGTYSCRQVDAYFAGSQGIGWYRFPTCAAYYTVTNPSRADSVETFPFTVTETDLFRRKDSPDGAIRYDSTTATLTVNYADRPSEDYRAISDPQGLLLIRRLPPLDFNSDSQSDSVIVYFLQDAGGAPAASR